MENRTGRTIGLILANASSSFTTAFMDLFQQELYQKDYKLVIGLTNHDLEKERFYLEFFGNFSLKPSPVKELSISSDPIFNAAFAK